MNIDTKKFPTKRSVNLPIEIIEEILPRLRVKSLLRLRCVSKSWLSLINSDRFIKTYLQHSTQNIDFAQIQVVFNHNLFNPLGLCSLRSLLAKEISTMNYLWCEFVGYNSVIVGCCNGLVCILKDESSFFLLNPATGVSNELPRIDTETLNIQYYGLGWDESSGAYKVFVDMLTQEGAIGKVYSSKTNSWKTVEQKGVDIDGTCERGQFVGGKLHWRSTSTNVVCYFDLKTEVFGMIELPSYPEDGCDRKLGVLGGCLCMVCDNSPEIEVLVMKENGVKESWLKLVTATHVHELIQQPFSAPIAADGNGEILVSCESNLLVYCAKDNVLGPPKVIDNFFEACVYVESLVSPGH